MMPVIIKRVLLQITRDKNLDKPFHAKKKSTSPVFYPHITLCLTSIATHTLQQYN